MLARDQTSVADPTRLDRPVTQPPAQKLLKSSAGSKTPYRYMSSSAPTSLRAAPTAESRLSQPDPLALTCEDQGICSPTTISTSAAGYWLYMYCRYRSTAVSLVSGRRPEPSAS